MKNFIKCVAIRAVKTVCQTAIGVIGASAVMSEAGLSYLGLGVAPPKPSLGLMLSDAQQTLLMAPWNIAMPAIVITLLVMSFNLIGDGIQEVTEQ